AAHGHRHRAGRRRGRDRAGRRAPGLGGRAALRPLARHPAGRRRILNGCELEITGLTGPHYDLERFGLRFVASPRHADCLLVTGPVTRNMAEALRRTWQATPDPKFVVAVGDCGRDGGLFRGSYAVVCGVADVVPDDAD